jgi:hypothetical protein
VIFAFLSKSITYGFRFWWQLTHMDVGNAGFAGAKTCPCATGSSELIRVSLIKGFNIQDKEREHS